MGAPKTSAPARAQGRTQRRPVAKAGALLGRLGTYLLTAPGPTRWT